MINRFHSGYRLKGTLANSEDLDEMPHWVAFAWGGISSRSALFARIKTTFGDITTSAFINLTCDPKA